MHGQVVQAVRGQRQHYRPIQSQLTESHYLVDIVAAILQVYPFDCLYIADLNAIMGDTVYPHHRAQVTEAMQDFPHLTWWIDAAIQDNETLQAWQQLGATPILASEGLPDFSRYQALQHLAPNAVLSLDFFADGYRGPKSLLAQPTSWPQQTILMSLPAVGANQGPDLARMAHLRKAAPATQLYAAGGVRNKEDIVALKQTGAAGVLIASALHQQQLTNKDLQSLLG